ncbi:DUF1456 family protein [Zobellia laminariae]|uniref:DUF1456 family protein n=1 Tax=Zobellia laminariae TaxID=248906 RepID=UPI0026F4158C|nr:DUF1456 family protein [Zobellia laminariae]WKX74947.1 DUF1456 family protein [Zobellia laminariae]
MTNNDVLKKLRVALMFRDDDIIDVLKLVDFKISKSELGAFFRKDDHPNYMECGDQVLRNFLNGLVIYLRGTKENPKTLGEVLSKKVIKPAAKVNHTKRPDFKTQQERRVNKDITNVKYKNKKKS